MKRSPLRRKTRLSPKRAAVRRSSRVLDEAYLAWVRLQPCSISRWIDRNEGHVCPSTRFYGSSFTCSGPTDPDHKRQGVGAGKRASDRDAWPVCRRHHGDRHALTGVFKGWTREQMREFIDARIAEANAAYEIHLKQAVPA